MLLAWEGTWTIVELCESREHFVKPLSENGKARSGFLALSVEQGFVLSGNWELPRGSQGRLRIRLEGMVNARLRKGKVMLYFALIFLIVGLIAGALSVLGVAAIAIQISLGLFVIGIVLIVFHLVPGRRTPVA